jgi:hypothetical protein
LPMIADRWAGGSIMDWLDSEVSRGSWSWFSVLGFLNPTIANIPYSHSLFQFNRLSLILCVVNFKMSFDRNWLTCKFSVWLPDRQNEMQKSTNWEQQTSGTIYSQMRQKRKSARNDSDCPTGGIQLIRMTIDWIRS